ncbi:DgyrCDS12469 [Dimorphilus gyrociliatus]|uniref:DgyrCDS12469 n=1 Tax=Dimorphilus gyrociliatus TaxID=2664684 RepID=A0A7I8W6J7_9ANNE|nr:DgyrCDS12469 [Dimorphilus gyrociliatus]
MRNFCYIFILLLPFAFTDSLVKITRSDRKIYLKEGDQLQLVCQVTGDATENPKLKWYNMNKKEVTKTNNNEDAFILSMAKNQLILFIKGLDKQAGKWSCKGTIAGVTHSDERIIDIYKGISFDGCDEFQYPKEGKVGLIRCKVKGSPPPSIVWFKNTASLNTAGKKYADTRDGLRINNLESPEDDGTYTLMASTDRETKTKIFRITVSTQPKITEGFQNNMKLAHRKKKTFMCKAESRPDAKYLFYRKKSEIFEPNLDPNKMRPLGSSDDYVVDGDKGFIQFNSPVFEDTGTYLCVAKNQAGSDSSYGFIRVHMRPDYVEVRQPSNARENAKADFRVTFRAYPFPEVIFQKRHNPSVKYELGKSYENGRIKVEKTDARTVTFKLDKASWKDYGNYSIILRNDEGKVVKNETLKIRFQPQMISKDTVVYAWAGAVRNLTCEVISYPEPSIFWYRKDRDNDNKQIMRRLESNETLVLYPLEKKIGGRYFRNIQVRVSIQVETWAFYDRFYCGASNKHGKAVNSTVKLERAEKPGPPKNVRELEVTPTTVTLAVDPPDFDGHIPLTGYRVSWHNMHLVFKLPRAEDQKLYIENLNPATTYTFKIQAVNRVGPGNDIQLSIQTHTSSAPKPIVIRGDRISVEPYSYEAKWKNPQTGGSPITWYYFQYRAVEMDDESKNVIRGRTNYKEKKVKDNRLRPMTSYTLTHLQENTFYELTIKAENNIGISKISDEFIFQTRTAKGYVGSNSNKATLHSTLILTALLLFIFRGNF